MCQIGRGPFVSHGKRDVTQVFFVSPAASIPAREDRFWRMLLASCPPNSSPGVLADTASRLIASGDLSVTALEMKATS